MCFSLSASFVAGSILSVIGVATISKVKAPSQFMFASLPLIFAIQQFTEGFVWLALSNSNYNEWQQIPITIFLIIAQLIWPVWVPLSILLVEKNTKRKKILSGLLVMGTMLSIYLAYCLLIYNVSATITPYHIRYTLDFPNQHIPYFAVLYFLPTILPPFISSNKKMLLLGTLILTSFLFTVFFFNDYILSVWCFFSALISGIVYLIVKKLNEKEVFTPNVVESILPIEIS